jgi:hypothetical protein
MLRLFEQANYLQKSSYVSLFRPRLLMSRAFQKITCIKAPMSLCFDLDYQWCVGFEGSSNLSKAFPTSLGPMLALVVTMLDKL